MKIGILQTGRSPEDLRDGFGDYDAFFRRLLAGEGFDFVTYAVLDGELPASPQDADGWLVTGSRHSVYEGLPWIAPLENFLRAAYAASIPIVGICFGHQILAQALGGKVEKFSGGWSVGAVPYTDADGHCDTLLAWHQDQVVTQPEEAEVTLTADTCQFAGLRYGDKAITFQPHPEFTPDFLTELVEARRSLVGDQVAKTALSSLAESQPATARFAREIADFFRNRD